MEHAALRVIDCGRMPYGQALDLQRWLVASKAGGNGDDYLLLVEHPRVVTLGRSAREEHLRFTRNDLAARGVEVFDVERGGDVTYHGPGQLVGYPIIDLKRAGLGVTEYLRLLESVLIEVLSGFGVKAFARKRLTGVWTDQGKIAAVGIAVRRWISFHGFAVNVNNDAGEFGVIVPCGLAGERVTSVRDITGSLTGMDAFKRETAEALARRLASPDLSGFERGVEPSESLR